MDRSKQGLHHITVIGGDPQVNVDFYVHKLGLKLSLKSVNQDDPGTYHLFYTNGSGDPGSSITFFPWPMARQNKAGSGEAVAVAFAVPSNSLPYWSGKLSEMGIDFEGPFDRFGKQVIQFRDPDNLMLELVSDSDADDLPGPEEGAIAPEHSIRGFWSTTLRIASESGTREILENILGFKETGRTGNQILFQTESKIGKSVIIENPEQPSAGKPGKGTVHHVAFRVKDEDDLQQRQQKVLEMGLFPTEVIDRHVFKSVYFRTPGGVLFEMATDGPGYNAVVSPEEQAHKLFLPPWLESRRKEIEERLPQLVV